MEPEALSGETPKGREVFIYLFGLSSPKASLRPPPPKNNNNNNTKGRPERQAYPIAEFDSPINAINTLPIAFL